MTGRGVPRFDCYPSDALNGMIGLTADQIAVYWVVLLLQYDRGGPVQMHGRERELAVRSGMSRGRLAKAVDGLVQLGKLQLENGAILNPRAAEELQKIEKIYAKNRANSKKGGEATAQKFFRKDNENNGHDRPRGMPNGAPTPRVLHPPSSILHPPIDNKPAAAKTAARDEEPPPHVRREEFEAACEQASQLIGLRNFDAIMGEIEKGAEPDRILSVLRERGKEIAKLPSSNKPTSWAYFLPAIRDPARRGALAAKSVPMVFIVEGSPAWKALIASGKRESFLRSIGSTDERGRDGVSMAIETLPKDVLALIERKGAA
jgi:hypothetical protein